MSKSKTAVTRQDWLRADQSKKISSLVVVGYDAGITPVEIAEAKIDWYDPKRNVMRIPTEHTSKQRRKTEVALAEETAEVLSEWIRERRHLKKYDETRKLWLNREGNSYDSISLCRLVRKLCEEVGISTEGRHIRWYSFRHTLVRNMAADGELPEASDQLRHESLSTTQDYYNETPIEQLQQRVNETREKANRAAEDPDYEPFDETNEQNTDQSSGEDVDVQPDESESVDTRVGGGRVHIDAVIPDTTEARADIARDISPDDEDDEDDESDGISVDNEDNADDENNAD